MTAVVVVTSAVSILAAAAATRAGAWDDDVVLLVASRDVAAEVRPRPHEDPRLAGALAAFARVVDLHGIDPPHHPVGWRKRDLEGRGLGSAIHAALGVDRVTTLVVETPPAPPATVLHLLHPDAHVVGLVTAPAGVVWAAGPARTGLAGRIERLVALDVVDDVHRVLPGRRVEVVDPSGLVPRAPWAEPGSVLTIGPAAARSAAARLRSSTRLAAGGEPVLDALELVPDQVVGEPGGDLLLCARLTGARGLVVPQVTADVPDPLARAVVETSCAPLDGGGPLPSVGDLRDDVVTLHGLLHAGAHGAPRRTAVRRLRVAARAAGAGWLDQLVRRAAREGRRRRRRAALRRLRLTGPWEHARGRTGAGLRALADRRVLARVAREVRDRR